MFVKYDLLDMNLYGEVRMTISENEDFSDAKKYTVFTGDWLKAKEVRSRLEQAYRLGVSHGELTATRNLSEYLEASMKNI